MINQPATNTQPGFAIGDGTSGLGGSQDTYLSLIVNLLEALRIDGVAGLVNTLRLTPAATGGGVTLAAWGSDADVDLNVNAQGAGSVVRNAPDVLKTPTGAKWTHGYSREVLTLSTVAAHTDTAGNLLPANSIIEAVTARVITTITTATDWDLSDPTTVSRFAAPKAVLTAGTTVVGLLHADQTGAGGPIQAAAAKVRVNTTGTPGAGSLEILTFWRSFVAPTS